MKMSLQRPIALFAAALLVTGLLPAGTALASRSDEPDSAAWVFPDGYEASDDPASMYRAAKGIKATRLWDDGVTGEGIDVALIDTGVRPSPVLPEGSVVAGPAFVTTPSQSAEDGQARNRRPAIPESLVDTDGHGTHLAAIIAGSSGGPETYGDKESFTGIAPDARVISIKVADESGEATLDQVMAAIEWVIDNRNTEGRNIRVLNLSLAAEPADIPTNDMLAHAVTMAWDAGIVVVAAAGNDGGGHRLASPAYEPRIISVGALDHAGSTKAGDAVPAESSSGTIEGRERPDIWAPGRSIASAVAIRSDVAANESAVRLGDDLVRGSGTSQATAIVSGAVALLLSHRPHLSPDQVAALLYEGADSIEVHGEEVDHARLDLDESVDEDLEDVRTSPMTEIIEGYSAADPATWDLDGDDGVDHAEGEGVYVGARWVGVRWVGARWVGARWVGARWVMEGWE